MRRLRLAVIVVVLTMLTALAYSFLIVEALPDPFEDGARVGCPK